MQYKLMETKLLNTTKPKVVSTITFSKEQMNSYCDKIEKLIAKQKKDKIIDEIYKANRALSFAMSLLSTNEFNCKQRAFTKLKEVSISLSNLESEVEND
jgi:predicted Zn-ribbon and HTH transcriptional regulator